MRNNKHKFNIKYMMILYFLTILYLYINYEDDLLEYSWALPILAVVIYFLIRYIKT